MDFDNHIFDETDVHTDLISNLKFNTNNLLKENKRLIRELKQNIKTSRSLRSQIRKEIKSSVKYR